MTASQFTIEEIQANTVTPEGRAFKACLDIARRGSPTSFKLVVNETITAAHVPGGGPMVRLVDKQLSFEVDIQVRADSYVVLRDVKMEDGDASSSYNQDRQLWICGEQAWEKSEQYFKAYKDPMTYLRLQAVQWATKALERALDAPGADPYRAFDGITDGIIDVMKEIAFQSDADGAAMVTKLAEVPRLVIEPSAIWGPTVYFNLVSTNEPIGDGDWKRLLLSFQLSDGEEAERVRDALVAEHCADYDSDYGYSWTDSAVINRDHFGSREALLDAIRVLEPETPILKGLRALGHALKGAGLMDINGRADFEVALAEGGDFDDYRSIIQSVRDMNEHGFKAFLEANGWTYKFDPLDVAEIRHLRPEPATARQPKP